MMNDLPPESKKADARSADPKCPHCRRRSGRLVTAALLVAEGIPVVVIEACNELPHDLRASTFHPPTLDMLEPLGVVGAMIDQGLICPTWQFRDRKDGVVATSSCRGCGPTQSSLSGAV